MVSIEKDSIDQSFVVEGHINETIESVKTIYNYWLNYYSNERANWPMTNIQAWSVSQTMAISNYRHFGLVEFDNFKSKELREKAVIGYLISNSASGVKSWAKGVLERNNLGLANKEECLLANLAVSYLTEGEKRTTEL